MAPYHRISVRVQATLPGHMNDLPPKLIRTAIAVLLLACAVVTGVHAQEASPRWRAAFLDTFNSRIGTPDEVTTVVTRATAMNANVLYVQVRRRGDAFYLDGNEPAPEGVAIDSGFDPLGDLLAKARAAGLEVHALVTLGPVWHLSTAPSDPRHVFTRHGFQGGRAVEGAENWLTRTLQPDGNGTSMDGYRFGNDYWLDFGHPAAATYVVDLVTRLVERYPVDGVRLDAVQYPEAPAGSASIGYNAVAVARFQARSGQSGLPGQDDARWSDWRREQITALIAPARRQRAGGPAVARRQRVGRGGRRGSRQLPGHRGLRAHVPGLVPVGRGRQRRRGRPAGLPGGARRRHGRGVRGVERPSSPAATGVRPFVIGVGAYQNSLEGLLRQTRTALDAAGSQGGVSFFSLAATNAPVVNNPLSSPAGRDTPQRPFEDFASALRTGRTTSGQVVDQGQPAGVRGAPCRVRPRRGRTRSATCSAGSRTSPARPSMARRSGSTRPAGPAGPDDVVE